MTRPPTESLERRLAPVLAAVLRRATVAGRFIDKDVFRILVCTLWANVVMDPQDAGIAEQELEGVHDALNDHIAGALGSGESLKTCFAYLNDKAGERAMAAARLTPEHRDLLLFFASMILDPDGHRRWAERVRRESR